MLWVNGAGRAGTGSDPVPERGAGRGRRRRGSTGADPEGGRDERGVECESFDCVGGFASPTCFRGMM